MKLETIKTGLRTAGKTVMEKAPAGLSVRIR